MSALLDALGWLGSSLDKPGAAVRGLLAGRPAQLANLIPFSDTMGITDPEARTRGTDLLGLDRDSLGGMLGGMGVEIATDPLNWLGGWGLYRLAAVRAQQRMMAGLPQEAATLTRAVDEGGRPLRVFHGTEAPFHTFRAPSPSAGDPLGVFFSASPEMASNYAGSAGKEGSRVVSAYLDARQPLDVYPGVNFDRPVPPGLAEQLIGAVEAHQGAGAAQSLREFQAGKRIFRNPLEDVYSSFRSDAADPNRILRELGYDSVRHADVYTTVGSRTVPVEDWAVLDPSRVYAPWLASGPPALTPRGPLLAALLGHNVLGRAS